MRLLLLIVLGLIQLINPCNAQPSEKHSFVTIGIDAGVYSGGLLSLSSKWVRENKTSFIVQINPYSYTSSSTVSSNMLSNELTTTGFTIKPGIIPLQHHSKYQYFYLSVMGVATYNSQQLKLIYQDAFGTSQKQYNQNNFTLGLEILGNIHHKVSSHIYLETGVRFGLKPNKVILKNPDVDSYNSYYEYAPSQGFGKGNIYANILFGIGYSIY